MVLGILFCDRYQLDADLYAMTVIVTTFIGVAVLANGCAKLPLVALL
ncbi:hypothetical protein [Methylocucumis oryzae]